MAPSASTQSRILGAAAQLFYDAGIAATCVDRVAERAGVSKPTLYAHFRSKDDLVAAVLESRHAERAEGLEEWLAEHGGEPRERLLSVFDWLAAWFSASGNRGCAFVNASVEIVEPDHPAREVARAHKRWMRGRLAELAAAAGVGDPAQMGSDLMILIDGANARMVVGGDPGVAADARRMAEVLLDAACRSSP